MAHDQGSAGARERHHREREAIIDLPKQLPQERIERAYRLLVKLFAKQIREDLAANENEPDSATEEAA